MRRGLAAGAPGAVNWLKVSAWLGIAFAIVEAAIKVVRAFHQPQWWAFSLYDYVPLLLLLPGGLSVLRGDAAGRWLTAGWAIVFADYYNAFFIHLEFMLEPARNDFVVQRSKAIATGPLLAIALIGLAAALCRTGPRRFAGGV